ncbi:MAG: ABC-ATPase domain-containing protein [Deltaproteobacteria bacterium]|nr:ABC-ATPase domain-containing protein [Deltaproteobacteria bacterium]
MNSFESLRANISPIDGQDYGAYQSIKGAYAYPGFNLFIDQIPKDPYAPPHTGIYRIQVKRSDPGVIDVQTASTIEDIAFRDFLTRNFSTACQEVSKGRRGTGNSGVITISQPGQAILDRSCIVINDDVIEVRCFVGLPAAGRKIKARVAATMLFEELPEIVRRSLFEENIDLEVLHRHIQTAVDAESLRSQLEPAGLVAFIADQAILPRKSGTSDQPLVEVSIPFVAPESMRVEFELPHAGRISGMGIRQGVSLIVGGGYHGKSTLLDAMAAGIYNHIPGDGRELCVSLPQTVKVRAYSGRSIEKTDISPFIRNLPFQKDTSAFCTENASGSTSQAANIIEAIEIGARLFLMDEDTCATNFMIRDKKMQELVNKADEPITAFIDKVRQLYLEKGVSTILVLGGAGDYFEVSDQVIQMIRYQAYDVTEKTRQIALASPGKRTAEDSDYPISPKQRNPLGESVSPVNDFGKKSIYAKEIYRFVFGGKTVDLTDVEQIIELTQTKTIAQALDYAKQYMDGKTSLRKVVERVIGDIEAQGLDILSDRISGHHAQFRRFELAFALNRLRGFEVLQQPE